MQVQKISFTEIKNSYKKPTMPCDTKNYCTFDNDKVDRFVSRKEASLPFLVNTLKHTNKEEEVVESLYILDRMLEKDVKGIDKMYPVLSRFNNTKSPNIQTFLAGIYRKTQVPDAFGPLVSMLVQNSINPPKANFDPNEEIGGAILSYMNERFRN
ncbi:MAG: hypothetical protein R3Y28_03385 [Candidatus Gastranaerophilales bacterium]